MNPHYIIDGYNVIYSVDRFRGALDFGLEHARTILVSFIRGYQSTKKLKITVVFDGDEVGFIDDSIQTSRWLKVIYSKPPEKADPVIKRLIQRANNKKSIILVSADNDLILFGKQMGVNVLSPDEFYYRVSEHPTQTQMDQKYNSHVSKDEIDEWLKLFKEENN